MINLTKFDGDPFKVNALHILKIDGHHETRITLLNGQTQLVKESEAEVEERITAYYQKIFTKDLATTVLESKG